MVYRSQEMASLVQKELARLRRNWRWSAFNLSALLTWMYVFTQGSTEMHHSDTFDPGLESGKWAVRLMLASLTMTPLNTYFGWSSAIQLRKSAGLWAFAFAGTHVLFYLREARLTWLTTSMPLYLALGLAGMLILSALAATSNRWSMKRLGKNWKRLHRFVYLAGVAITTHSMLAAIMSKKLIIRDPQAQSELKIYTALLCILLVIRIPRVRQWLKKTSAQLRHALDLIRPLRKTDSPDRLPPIHGRESSVSLKPTFMIPNEITNQPKPSSLGGPRFDLLPEDEESTLPAETYLTALPSSASPRSRGR